MSDRVAAGKLVSLTYSIQDVRKPSAAYLRADADDGDADAGTLH
jgi:hypothetical protein